MKGRRRRLPASGVALLVAFASLPGGLTAQYEAPPPPAAYALQNVTVVGADGTRSEGLTLVVRAGAVETLAPGAEVPADAMLLEGDSLFVYPGLVDGQASAAFEFPEARDTEGDDDVNSWDPPRSRSGFTPHRVVAHHLTAVGEDLEGPRSDGIVAGLVHPTSDMAAGQPAVLVFRDGAGEPWELVVREAHGLTMSFRGGRGVYPSQLFGVIAYLRQAFLDAERYGTIRAAWERNPDGLTPPAWDPDYEALLRATRGSAPVHFAADSDEDIRRVLDLADEFGFRPVIVGGAEAWKLAEELARRDVPVLVSVDFPESDDWDPEADTVEAELEPDAAREKERLEAVWSNAGRLEEAGVTFALTTGGGSAELLEGARKAVEYGLSEAAALRAVTSTPAAMLGLSGFSRVAAGGPATFLVADGELLAEETGVVYTFLEGHLTRGREVSEGGDGGEAASDVSGEWEGSVGAEGMSFGLTMNLDMEPDGTVSGTLVAEGQGEADVTGSVSGREVTLTIEAEGMPEPIVLTGTLSEDGTTIEGSGSTPMGELEFRVTRRPGAAASARSWSELFGGRSDRTGGGA